VRKNYKLSTRTSDKAKVKKNVVNLLTIKRGRGLQGARQVNGFYSEKKQLKGTLTPLTQDDKETDTRRTSIPKDSPDNSYYLPWGKGPRESWRVKKSGTKDEALTRRPE